MKENKYLEITIYEPKERNNPIGLYWVIKCISGEGKEKKGNFIQLARKPTFKDIAEQTKELGITL
jgi:hypothetical protein